MFFTDTNGGNNPTPSQSVVAQYAPLQQLATDLASDTVADYNWITPNQFNDMHTALSGGYKGLTGDAAKIKQGDDFLKPDRSHHHGVASLQEPRRDHHLVGRSRSGRRRGDTADDFNHTLAEIVISQHAHANVNGVPYASPLDLHAFLRPAHHAGNLPRGPAASGDAANANDLSDLFEPGSFPKKP